MPGVAGDAVQGVAGERIKSGALGGPRVAGGAKLGVAGERIKSDALGGPENCPSDSASLLAGLIIQHAVMSSRMRCCRSGLRKKCIFNVDSLLFLSL